MSLKNIFSKKQQKDLSASKIGSNNSVEKSSFEDESFLKQDLENQILEISVASEFDMKNQLNLTTDVSISDDVFLSHFVNSEEKEDEIKSLNDLNSLSFSLEEKEEVQLNLFDMSEDKLKFEKEVEIISSGEDFNSITSLENLDVQTILADTFNERSENKDFDKYEEDEDLLASLSLLKKETINDLGLSNLSLSGDDGLDTPTRSSLDIPSISSWNSSSVFKDKVGKVNKNRELFSGILSVKSQYMLFFTMLIASTVGVGTSMHLKTKATEREAIAIKYTSELWASNQKFGSSFKDATMGLSGEYDNMVKNWDEVQTLNKQFVIAINALSNNKITEQIKDFEEDLTKIGADVRFMMSQENLLKNVSEMNEEINKNINILIATTEKIGVIYVQIGATQSELAQIYALKGALENIKAATSNILYGDVVRQESITLLNINRELFKTTLTELSSGSQAKDIRKLNPIVQPIYNILGSNWLFVANNLDKIIKNIDNLNKTKELAKTSQTLVIDVHKELKELLDLYDGSTDGHSLFNNALLIISMLILLGSVAALMYVYSFEKERLSLNSKNESEKNRNAILKLLSEMMPLQDGDLTQKTSLDEGSITEDISRSVNATIESLASVVKQIKETSLVMKTKTNEMNGVSVEMLKSTEQQASSIIETGESVIKITKAIGDISEKTKLSLITAQNSAKASTVGSQHVRDSIDSMTMINKNMDETVHLMKKVSDSSKQISEVIGLLSDITEETNILALNATVQAAKAGEAGKGFKIVAESIQDLADNAAEATRRVGALIATVQTDIQSVSLAVQKTTSEVIRGVELSGNAGKSLDEINVISNELAEIVQTISKEAVINAEAAKQISNNMEKILNVTEETKSSTQKTTSSLSDIVKMSDELEDSVQSFIVR